LTVISLVAAAFCCGADLSRAGCAAGDFSPHVFSFQVANVIPRPRLATAAGLGESSVRDTTQTLPAETPEPPAASSDTVPTHHQRMAAGLFLWLGLVLGLVGLGACVLLLARQRNRE